MKKIFLILIFLLFLGCIYTIPVVDDYGLHIKEFEAKNFNIIFIHKSADSIVYVLKVYEDIGSRYDEYNSYTFINSILSHSRNNWTGTIPSEDEQMKISWMSEHYSFMVKQMGSYTRKVDDGLGGEILIWSQHTDAKTEWDINPFYSLTGNLFYESHTPGVTHKLEVFCDSDSLIYDIRVSSY